MKTIEEFSRGKKKVRRRDHQAEKKKPTERQKNKTGDSKVESNDHPKIQDRRETSDPLASLWGHKPMEYIPTKKYNKRRWY